MHYCNAVNAHSSLLESAPSALGFGDVPVRQGIDGELRLFLFPVALAASFDQLFLVLLRGLDDCQGILFGRPLFFIGKGLIASGKKLVSHQHVANQLLGDAHLWRLLSPYFLQRLPP